MLKSLGPYRRFFLAGFVCLVLASPAGLFHPVVWMFVVDEVLLNERIHLLVPALGVMVGVHAFSVILGAARDRLFERAGQLFVRDLRNQTYRKLNRQSARYIQNQRTGDLMARVISDIDTIQGSLVNGITRMFEELVTFTVVIGIILAINWKVGIVTLFPLALVYLILHYFNPRIKALYGEARRRLGAVSAKLQDNLAGFAVIRAFNQGKREEDRFADTTQSYFEKMMEAVRLRTILFPSVFMVGFTTNVIMLGLGAWFVWRGEFTIGGLVAFRGYWWQLNSPIRTLAQVNDLIQRAVASTRRVYEILDAPVEIQDEPDARVVPSGILPLEMRNVSFHYDPVKPVVRDLSFRVAPGERLGLVGRSGGGKSTVLALIARFYDPVSGEVRYGDAPLTAFRQDSWHGRLGMVFQETFLFNTTIRENILYGRPEASEEALIHAAMQANADDFIRALPHGYDTMVGERGVKLSGGQRQRIGVARAFLADPAVLLLDEPTSSVEPESEQIIQESIEKLMEGRTVILSSHRPSLLRGADRLIVLQSGRIVEHGSHRELLARRGPYWHMILSWDSAQG